MQLNFFERAIGHRLLDLLLNSDKIIILYGPRQSGKTTLVNSLLKDYNGKVLSVNADRLEYLDVLSSRDFNKLSRLVSGYDLVFIDEAQRIPDIGINLKILHDELPKLRIIVTGSSSLDLANSVREPLTGRTITLTLYPISILELKKIYNPFEVDSKLEEIFQFGSYPKILSTANAIEKEELLRNLSHDYLYKDVLDYGGIRNSGKIRDLLRLLAYQTGSLVSYNELSKQLGLSNQTVQSYIDLLEKSFVVFSLPGFSKNLRKEIIKNKKIYFYDLGMRNAILENFNAIQKRNDIGAIWENFLISERIKTTQYLQLHSNRFFWRTYTGAELDYVEERGGMLSGYEFKWGNKKQKAPKSWLEVYPEASYYLINKENYLEFL